jgi:hypothetical protein
VTTPSSPQTCGKQATITTKMEKTQTKTLCFNKIDTKTANKQEKQRSAF